MAGEGQEEEELAERGNGERDDEEIKIKIFEALVGEKPRF